MSYLKNQSYWDTNSSNYDYYKLTVIIIILSIFKSYKENGIGLHYSCTRLCLWSFSVIHIIIFSLTQWNLKFHYEYVHWHLMYSFHFRKEGQPQARADRTWQQVMAHARLGVRKLGRRLSTVSGEILWSFGGVDTRRVTCSPFLDTEDPESLSHHTWVGWKR